MKKNKEQRSTDHKSGITDQGPPITVQGPAVTPGSSVTHAPIITKPHDSVLDFRRKQIFRLYMYGGGVLLLAGIFAASLYLLDQEVTKVQHARGAQASLSAELNAFASLIKDKNPAEEARLRLVRDLPSPLDIPTVLLPHVKTLARARNLRVDVNLGAASPNQPSSMVNLSVRADGSMQNILDFVNDLENDNTVMSVTSWSISSTGSSNYQLNLDATLYTQTQ